MSRVLVALDITEQVVEESGLWGAQLVVSHHPVIFHPVKTITDASPLGRTLLRLAELGIAAICAHTNLDAAQGGVNDVLAHRLALVDTAMLHQDGTDCQGRPYGIGRVGPGPSGGAGCVPVRRFCKGATGCRVSPLCGWWSAGE